MADPAPDKGSDTLQPVTEAAASSGSATPAPTHAGDQDLQSTQPSVALSASLLARAVGMARPDLLRVLKEDQRRRWSRGERLPVEVYREQVPTLREDTEGFLDLVYHEFVLREERGERPDLEEYCRRFPEHVDALSRLLALHRELAAKSAASGATISTHLLPPAQSTTEPVAALPTARRDKLPEQFGRYRILRLLGRGGMGAVYLAHDNQLDRDVALKIPTLSGSEAEQVLERFHREARAAATLAHPHICPVYDVGVQDGSPYLTMAYVEGQPLTAHARTGNLLPAARVAALIRGVALALAYAHGRGVIHRDLKPANILLNVLGEPIVMDFGLARRSGTQDVRLTQSGQLMGTPAYMSPEQVAGDAARVGPGYDIYSLGVVLYELLTGRLPFEGSWTEVLAKILTQDPPPPSSLCPDLPAGLDAVCRKAIARQVEERYATMAEFAAALQPWTQGGTPVPVSSRPIVAPRVSDTSVTPAAGSSRRQPRWRWIAAGVVALLVVLGISWNYLLRAPAVGKVRIELDPADAGAEVSIDGKVIDKALLGEPLELPTGSHTLRVTATGRELVEKTFEVVSGVNEPLRVALPAVVVRVKTPPDRPPPEPVKEPARPRPFVGTKEVYTLMRAHLDKLPVEARPYQRYFTLAHLHNDARLTEADLRVQKAALAKTLNSLSWKPAVVLPEALDVAGVIFALDLRRVLWDADQWDEVLKRYPYGLKHDRYPEDAVLNELARDVYKQTGSDVPAVRVDWFIATALRAPLYYTLLKLPKKLGELEAQLKVDVAADFTRDQLLRVGLSVSGESSQNRLLQRHDSVHGAYWRTYDFRMSDGVGDLLRRPLGPLVPDGVFVKQAFKHDGGEVLFSLPNGLHGYLIVNESDERLDEAPAELVSDALKTAGTTKMVGGLSCLACHDRGIKGGVKDVVREGSALEGEARDKVRRLYRPADDLKAALDGDEQRFLKALEKATGSDAEDAKDLVEPIGVVARRHWQEVGLREAALELGLADPALLRMKIENDMELRRLGLAPLAKDGTIRREAWESLTGFNSPFQDAANSLDLGTPKRVR